MKYLFCLLLCLQANVFAKETKVLILDEWQCGKEVCSVAQDDKGNVLFLISDKDGVFQIWIRGRKVWERKVV